MIAIPVALQNLLTTTGSMVETIMIAPLDETTVGAVGLCAQFTSLMFSCYWGFVGSGMLFFSQYWGAKDDEGIDRSYGITISFMLLVAITFACLGMLAPEWVMAVYTDKANIQRIGVDYLRVVGFAYPMQILSMGMSALLRSTERVRIPFYAAIASVLTNMLLNWLLIHGHCGFPAMGVQGAALATVIAAVVLPCVCLSGLVFKAPYLLIFACCYIDEPIRFMLMQRHMYSGRWVRPATPEGQAALPAFQEKRKQR